jgi:tRNA threonylcarbamoyladenosine biosynthesis protein TsaB
VIVLGIETSTPHTSVAIGNDLGIVASASLEGRLHQEQVIPTLEQLLRWSDVELSHIGGVAVGIGPGLFTGLRVGLQTAKSLAQVLTIPILGLVSLDVLAFPVRHTSRLIAAVIDARRGEVFWAVYRPVPGGVVRESDFGVGPPDRLVAELEALGEDVLVVGDGAILYRRQIEDIGGQVDFASAMRAHPQAGALVELTIPRFLREEFDRPADVLPLYLRRSDAEIAMGRRAGGEAPGPSPASGGRGGAP